MQNTILHRGLYGRSVKNQIIETEKVFRDKKISTTKSGHRLEADSYSSEESNPYVKSLDFLCFKD